MDADRERQLRELAQRKDAALLQMRTALLESEESRPSGQVTPCHACHETAWGVS